KSDGQAAWHGVGYPADQGGNTGDTKQRPASINCQDVIRRAGLQSLLQLCDYSLLDVGEKSTELFGLLDQGIKKLVLGDPLSKPLRQIDMVPAMTSFERRMLEFADAARESAL